VTNQVGRLCPLVGCYAAVALLQAGGRHGEFRAYLYEGSGGVLRLGDGGHVEVSDGAGPEDQAVG